MNAAQPPAAAVAEILFHTAEGVCCAPLTQAS